MVVDTIKNRSKNSDADVKPTPTKIRKSEPVRLGTLFPALLSDIEKRIQKRGVVK